MIFLFKQLKMKRIASVISIILLFVSCVSRESADKRVKIEVRIIGKSDSNMFNGMEGRFYSTNIDFVNNTDSAIYFWTKSCSWEDNWISNSKTLHLINPGCDSNYPCIVQVESGKSITYKGTVRLYTSLEEARDIIYRLGFILIRKKEVTYDLEFNEVLSRKREKGVDLIWSESFKISK
jgi:hypothetical protein